MDQMNMGTTRTMDSNFKSILTDVSDEMQKCIQNCIQCAQACELVIQHCLSKGGSHAEQAHIRRLQDCVEICTLSSHFMLRDSQHHAKTCGVCEAICLDCAVDCERMSDDEVMKACAEVCRQCAESCRKMSAAH